MMERLIDALLNATWQTVLVAALVALALRAIPRTSASVRCAIWSAALCIAVALPVADFLGARTVSQDAVSAPNVTASSVQNAAPLRVAANRVRVARVARAAPAEVPQKQTPLPVFLALFVHRVAQIGFAVWIAGMLFFGVRFIYQMTCLLLAKNAIEPMESLTLAHGMRSRRPVRIGVSDRVAVPCLLGLIRPVIALPRALARELTDADLQRVVLHETAHLQRGDDWFNLIEQAALVVFFFNPALHYIARCIGMEREIACDDHVVAQSQNRITYAECLTALARRCTARRALTVPGFFTNRRQIFVRIEELLDRGHNGSRKVGPKAFAAIAAVAACGLVLAQFGIPVIASGVCPLAGAPLRVTPTTHVNVAAFLELPAPVRGATAARAVPRVLHAESPHLPGPHIAPVPVVHKTVISVKPVLPKRAPVAQSKISSVQVSVVDSNTQTVSDASVSSDSGSTAVAMAAAPTRSQDGSFADGIASSGYANLSVDQLIALRDHGVTPASIQALKAAGYANLSPQELIDLRDHGVDGAYASAMAALARRQVGVQTLIELRDHGVSVSYANALAAGGLHGIAFEQLIELRDHGVSARYISELARSGYAGLSAQEAIELRDHGVTTTYIEHIRKDINDRRLSVDELVRLRDAGI